MWMNAELTTAHKNFIYSCYSKGWELQCCIKEFQTIFRKRNVPLLYLFIEKYCKCKIRTIKSFVEGLKREIDALENAVAYDYSNGFVEGTNNRYDKADNVWSLWKTFAGGKTKRYGELQKRVIAEEPKH